MLSTLKLTIFLCCLVICSFLTLSFYLRQQQTKQNVTRRDNADISSKSITALGDNKTYIISAYYDSRITESVRVLAIIHESVKELYCRFHCTNKDNILVAAQIDLHIERYGFPYGTADLLCEEPPNCVYVYVSVHWSKTQMTNYVPRFEVKNRVVGPFSANFTVCISALYGEYNNVLQMIQSFEMYKLLGANRVTIYKNGCHENVEKVLQYYVKEGFLDVVTWPIDRYLRTSAMWNYSSDPNSQISYYGQAAALNDCIYRNMFKSQFILLNDIDEIILPTSHRDWKSLLLSLKKKHPNTSVFRFSNHVFPAHINGAIDNKWNNVPGVNMFLHNYREPLNHKAFDKRKMIINPRKMFQISIHRVLTYVGKSTDFNSEVGILFHCRKTERPELAPESLIEDNILWRYRALMMEKVDGVINNIHLNK
ncbi:beta-1,4-galactosyltransferase galt-1-like [Bombina bombina]|uniref:beta-1,4-galactosyltransferase galt-1-like n=1 Tax=Bombina bombina TaxID=8345 RepID=UPI00235ADE57|nr:beta-1,4-galactosyltransferase galt-1-like [Bombina bombina]